MNAAHLPPAPSPGSFFRAYPTALGAPASRHFRARPRADRPGLDDTLALRDYEGVKRIFESRPRIQAVLTALDATPDPGATAADLARTTGLTDRAVTRILYWLMKYDFAE